MKIPPIWELLKVTAKVSIMEDNSSNNLSRQEILTIILPSNFIAVYCTIRTLCVLLVTESASKQFLTKKVCFKLLDKCDQHRLTGLILRIWITRQIIISRIVVRSMSPKTLVVNPQPIKETGIRFWRRIRSLEDTRGPKICQGSNKSKSGAKLDLSRETTIRVRFKTYLIRYPQVCFTLQAQLMELDHWPRSKSSQTNLDITSLIWARSDLVKMIRYNSLIAATIPYIRLGITSKQSLSEMTQIQIFWRLIWIKAGKWFTTMVEPNLKRTI